MEDSQVQEARLQEAIKVLQEATKTQGGTVSPSGEVAMGKLSSTTGVVYVWDTRTYEKIPVLDYMLTSVLRKRRQEDGSYQFTMNDPKTLPIKGQVKCMLHPSDPNREHYNELGFRVCVKANIKNLHEREMHMKRRHSQEWEAVERERKEKERAEDRALQHLLLANQMAKGEYAEKPKIEPQAKTPAPEKFVCKKCGADFTKEAPYRKHEESCNKN